MSDTPALHVLVINDTQEILNLFQELLEEEGYRVTISLALLDSARLRQLAPDVIVQDLVFGDSKDIGWKFLTMVRLDPRLRHIPLVLCTAATDVKDPDVIAHLEQLQVRVVVKPFDLDVLLETLTLALTEAQEARDRKDA
jgi:two-component system response regulator VicR